MALLSVNSLYKNFSGETLLKDITFSIDEKDKIGIIGVNGTGKTTLIKMILGEENYDSCLKTNRIGSISKKNGLHIGYLSQEIKLNESNRLYDELMEVFSDLKEDYERIQTLNDLISSDFDNFDKHMKELGELSSKYEQENGYAVEYKVNQVLIGLNVPKELWYSKINTLSGGQKTRVALGKIILENPDILILDEPTNHLDLIAIEWLEKYLRDYQKAFIVISHDRYFLDSITNRIFEIERKKLKIYRGNFSDYVIQKEAYLSGAIKSFEKEQDKIRKMEEFVRRYKAGQKSKQARGRQKLLNRMEKSEDPVTPIRKIHLKFEIDYPSVDRVVELKNLKIGFKNKNLMNNVNFTVYKGDRIGIIGKNGIGKSTILKAINGENVVLSGEIKIGERVKIGYYDQNHQGLDNRNTVLEELLYNYPLSNEEARDIAGGFLFSSDDVDKKIESLSGGEKARVALMKLILLKPNLLILDEPTNHLDIYSREILEEALELYEGTIIVVSHDRHFLECVVNKIYEIKNNGFKYFEGNYDEYLSQKNNVKIKDIKNSLNHEIQKMNRNKISNLENKCKKLEKNIEKLELEKMELDKKYEELGVINDVERLISIQKEIDLYDELILNELSVWQEFISELENLKNIEK